DFDELAVFEAFRRRAGEMGLGDLVDRITDGWTEATPRGVHVHYRCVEIAGNTELAKRPKRPEEMRDGHDKVKTLIQTRGEGGFGVAAPSNGTVHPSGKPYVRLAGGPATVATITAGERRDLWALARTFDQMPKPEATASGQATAAGDRPGDDFNRRAD